MQLIFQITEWTGQFPVCAVDRDDLCSLCRRASGTAASEDQEDHVEPPPAPHCPPPVECPDTTTTTTTATTTTTTTTTTQATTLPPSVGSHPLVVDRYPDRHDEDDDRPTTRIRTTTTKTTTTTTKTTTTKVVPTAPNKTASAPTVVKIDMYPDRPAEELTNVSSSNILEENVGSLLLVCTVTVVIMCMCVYHWHRERQWQRRQGQSGPDGGLLAMAMLPPAAVVAAAALEETAVPRAPTWSSFHPIAYADSASSYASSEWSRRADQLPALTLPAPRPSVVPRPAYPRRPLPSPPPSPPVYNAFPLVGRRLSM